MATFHKTATENSKMPLGARINDRFPMGTINHNNTHKTNRHNIVTFSRTIDQLLGGGIPLGSVTEIAGLPGTGKTQLGMQLCVNARLPKSFGGVDGQHLLLLIANLIFAMSIQVTSIMERQL